MSLDGQQHHRNLAYVKDSVVNDLLIAWRDRKIVDSLRQAGNGV